MGKLVVGQIHAQGNQGSHSGTQAFKHLKVF